MNDDPETLTQMMAAELALYGREKESCWLCGGDRQVLVGADIDCEDAVNGPFDGDVITCPCCDGSGDAADESYW